MYIDSARTVDSLSAVLRTAREITSGRVICVFGAATHHEPARRGAVAKTLESHSDTVILTSASDYLDNESATAACDIGRCFTAERETKIVPDRAEAMALGLSEARSGDTVLIFGHGSPLENGPLTSFCDRLFTRQWLYENQTCNSI